MNNAPISMDGNAVETTPCVLLDPTRAGPSVRAQANQRHRVFGPLHGAGMFTLLMTAYGSSSSVPLLRTGLPDSWNTTVSARTPLRKLELAAKNGDEYAFVDAARMIDWSSSSVGVFHEGVRLALMAGAHLFARNLANEGAALYPQDSELKKMARILAPPRVVDADVPPSPSVRTNATWLREHADEYKGLWVALQEGNLVATGATAREAWDRSPGSDDVMLTKVF